jgi:hypothetical protein
VPDDSLTRLLVDEAERFRPLEVPPWSAVARGRRSATGRARGPAAVVLALASVVGVALLVGSVGEPQDQTGSADPPVVAASGRVDDSSTWPLEVSDAPCPTGSAAAIDFVPFVQVAEVMYVATGTRTTAQLGRTVLTTRCDFSEGAPTGGYQRRTGDAAHLPIGTALRELVGFDPRFRLGVVVDGRTLVYEASWPEEGRGTASDLWPGFAGHVVGVGIASEADGETPLTRITDPARVRRLADQLATAPWSARAGFGDSDGFLVLRLDDGSALRVRYQSTTGQLIAGVQAPPAFRDELLQALRTGEGVPSPRCIAVPGDAPGPRDAEAYVGLTETAARELAARERADVRVVGRDGTCGAEGPRNAPDRVNVDVRDGVVRDAARY